jgi:hypothetical protein
MTTRKPVSKKKPSRPARRKLGALTAAQAEQLYILLEEAAEVIKVSAKILRFGLDSANPFDAKRVPNKTMLESEIGDFEGVVENLKAAGIGISTSGIRKARNAKRKRMQRWLMEA